MICCFFMVSSYSNALPHRHPPQLLSLLLESSEGIFGTIGAGGRSAAEAGEAGEGLGDETEPVGGAERGATAAVPEPLRPLLVGLYLACGLVGRVAEQLSLMDTPRRGRLTRPVPEPVLQVRQDPSGSDDF